MFCTADDWMAKAQSRGVQRLPAEAAQRLDQHVRRPGGYRETPAVDGVADQRVAPVREMHADLMRATGLELHIDIGCAPEPLEDGVMRDRRLADVATLMRVRSTGWRPIGASMVPPPVSTPDGRRRR